MDIDLGLLRLLQLVSPSLPVGMYSYSQGFEQAVENAWVTDEAQAKSWLSEVLHRGLARLDAPILARLHQAWLEDDLPTVKYWSANLMARRETAELRAEDRQTGQALARLLDGLGVVRAQPWRRHTNASFATLFALAAVEWGIACEQAVSGYLWSWLENQVLCAVKLVPLGQLAGQRILRDLAAEIPPLAAMALNLPEQAIGSSCVALNLASARHERQYSRLFRS